MMTKSEIKVCKKWAQYLIKKCRSEDRQDVINYMQVGYEVERMANEE